MADRTRKNRRQLRKKRHSSRLGCFILVCGTSSLRHGGRIRSCRRFLTAASLHYEGSLTISADLAALVQLREYEKILVGNLRNGERFETYVIYGSPRKGSIQLNGATAHLGTIGDRITIMNFAHYSPEEAVLHQPRIIVLDENNRVVRKEGVPTFAQG